MPLPPNLERSTHGILVNDLNGLCLISKGNMSTSATTNTNTNNSGVYTNLTRLASTLTPYQMANMNNENPPSPLITIELEGPTSILIKEYDGHTVAMKVPNRKNTNDQGAAD
ncbi:MAG: hypothetical protein ACI8RD_002108 [Bacillariaceae sp.]|jgi:hypothetical protein